MVVETEGDAMEDHRKIESRTMVNESVEARNRERADRFYSRVFLFAISFTLPLTIIALWVLAVVAVWPEDRDIQGLLAISVGIVGLLVFFIFLYKFQMNAAFTRNGRRVAMLLHALVVILLFLTMVWLAFDSPWKHVEIWGHYDLQEGCKPWIIAVLVIGSITLLGSLFDYIRRRLGGEYSSSGEELSREND
ncbi:MAG: hypothetical protein C0600_13580 [Ignavibacteria bacterium]|nr:MAG: hypothetical protein C0600_13580 [Ignavibacteria bacterium]